MQQALDVLQEWAHTWCVSINKEKSSTTLFTHSNKQKAGKLKMGDSTIQQAEEATYLGVAFDRWQTWKPHLARAEAKARKKLTIVRKLAGTDWGANEQILKRAYEGAVRPCLQRR